MGPFMALALARRVFGSERFQEGFGAARRRDDDPMGPDDGELVLAEEGTIMRTKLLRALVVLVSLSVAAWIIGLLVARRLNGASRAAPPPDVRFASAAIGDQWTGEGTKMLEVIYYSMTGNTRKVAEAIATELGVVAEEAKAKGRLAEDSLVFLGAGKYGPLRGWGLKRFIDRNDFQGRKVALFGTSGNGTGEEVEALEELVAAKGAEIAGRFHCRGRFLFIFRGHPTSEDLANARRFAREIAGN